MTMEQDVRLNVDKADRALLFDLLVDGAEKLKDDAIVLKGMAGGSGRFASGTPEIVEIILAVGSAGGFAALAAILREYFKQRPNGQIEIEQSESKTSRTIKLTASGTKAEELTKSFAEVLR
jgi:hypothetical protein